MGWLYTYSSPRGRAFAGATEDYVSSLYSIPPAFQLPRLRAHGVWQEGGGVKRLVHGISFEKVAGGGGGGALSPGSSIYIPRSDVSLSLRARLPYSHCCGIHVRAGYSLSLSPFVKDFEKGI